MPPLEDASVRRVLFDLITTELRQSRNLGIESLSWTPSSDQHCFDDQGLALDSLEFLNLAARVSDLFGLYQSQIGDRLLAARSLEAWCDLVQRFLDVDRIHFSSSGSTGEPSQNAHRYAELHLEAAYFANSIQPKRVLALVPSHHIYGFIWTVLLPAEAGILSLDQTASRKVVHGALEAGDVIVAAPPWWAYWVNARLPIPAGVTGICSTGPMKPAHAAYLRGEGLDLYEIYGASETAGIGYRRASAAYRLLPWWRLDEQARLIRDGAAPILPPDHLSPLTRDTFELLGRRDRAVQVAGHNISLAHVREKLLACPSVTDAHVRLMRPDEGDRLKAIVVPDRLNASQEDIRLWARTELLPHERPRLTFATQIARSELGKVQDWS